MSKVKKKFVCNACDTVYALWQGKCDKCGGWSTIEEVSSSILPSHINDSKAVKAQNIKEFDNHDRERMSTGFGELDNVLGGGLVKGSLVLLGGDPGIGKSTLSLQVLINLSKKHKVLYVSGEESGSQLRGRAERVDEKCDFAVFPETALEKVITLLEKEKPDMAVIDSIQTIYSQEIMGVGGGVAQIAYATNLFMQIAKRLGITLLLIGHVTKDGELAGPKTLEHMVDAVLYLEGERNGTLKMLKSVKNRFGSTGEVGVFELKDVGMEEVSDPSRLFLGSRKFDASGVCRFPSLEGSRVIMMEIEVLTSQIAFGYPRRTTLGFDQGRLSTLCAILQKRLNIKLDNQDVYLNVAGGFDLKEKEADLPAAIAIVSSLYDIVLPKDFAASGEVSLSGEVRAGKLVEKRLKESEKLNFKYFMGAVDKKGQNIMSVKSINEALQMIRKLTKVV